jgi:hypothetical protein
LKNWRLLVAMLALVLVHPSVGADAPLEPRAEVAAALKGMGDSANAHDVERHVGYYAHIPNVTLIVDGEPLVGWDTIRDKQKEWWNNGKTDVVLWVNRGLLLNIIDDRLLARRCFSAAQDPNE